MKDLLLNKKNKKGSSYGIEVVIGIALGLFVLLLITVAIIAGSNSLLNSNIFTAGTANYNTTSGMITNLTNGASSFFGSSGTFFSILVVVVIMILLGLMIGAVYVIYKVGSGGRGGIGSA